MNAQSHFDITLYAPSGRLWETQALSRAEAFLRQAGHRVRVDADIKQTFQRFSGDDETRLAAVHRVLRDAPTGIALAVRGGYGWTRLLDRLDYAALSRDKKRWLGHSDFTAFQLAALAKAQRITFAGPMACYDFGAEEVSAFTVNHCFGLLAVNRYEIACVLRGDRSLTTAGTLWGGNLSMIVHLIGTPYFPNVDNGILFLEDVNEEPYRIERMLYQLHHSGVLARQRAVLLGHFAELKTSEQITEYTLDTAIDHIQRISGVPFFRGLPFGHVRDKLTLPVGAPCELTIGNNGQTRLVCWDYLP
ncbi:MAG: LD-carboxypeptidase [Proteobacteria bacterium]|nr:LD-carboxypeptidase [Pseudomonadota bacterium]MCL2308051.1 LD-carboxypeptidase [Pseudomonadota bacterium]